MITIKENLLEEAVSVSHQIPEFQFPYELDEYEKRLKNPHLVLTAYMDERTVGFKIGYERNKDGSFYSWMGGVLSEYRKKGIAGQLADYQEEWARTQGYISIKIKTRNKHKGMIAFLLNRGFRFIGEDSPIPHEETRVLMEKIL